MGYSFVERVPSMTDLVKVNPLDVIHHWEDETHLPRINAASARQYLKAFGLADQYVQSAEINLRIGLGNLLAAIQRDNLYEEWGYKTWTEFRNKGLDECGISQGTASRSIVLAASKTLQQLPPSERGRISLANGSILARQEKINGYIRPEVIEQAKTLPAAKLALAVGANIPVCVRVWVLEPGAAEHVARIGEFTKKLSADAAKSLADLLESDDIKLLAGDGTDNNADLLIAVLQIAIQNEIDLARARMRTVGQTSQMTP